MALKEQQRIRTDAGHSLTRTLRLPAMLGDTEALTGASQDIWEIIRDYPRQ